MYTAGEWYLLYLAVIIIPMTIVFALGVHNGWIHRRAFVAVAVLAVAGVVAGSVVANVQHRVEAMEYRKDFLKMAVHVQYSSDPEPNGPAHDIYSGWMNSGEPDVPESFAEGKPLAMETESGTPTTAQLVREDSGRVTVRFQYGEDRMDFSGTFKEYEADPLINALVFVNLPELPTA